MANNSHRDGLRPDVFIICDHHDYIVSGRLRDARIRIGNRMRGYIYFWRGMMRIRVDGIDVPWLDLANNDQFAIDNQVRSTVNGTGILVKSTIVPFLSLCTCGEGRDEPIKLCSVPEAIHANCNKQH
jgi:hypothetical protein